MPIVGEEVTTRTLENMKRDLDKSSYRFYLTGSRFFGSVHSFSDWDYFTAENIGDIEDFLTKLGFKEVTSRTYLDTNTVKVLTWGWGAERIDVQIVKNASNKVKAQAAIKKLGIYPTTEMWNLCWELLA